MVVKVKRNQFNIKPNQGDKKIKIEKKKCVLSFVLIAVMLLASTAMASGEKPSGTVADQQIYGLILPLIFLEIMLTSFLTRKFHVNKKGELVGIITNSPSQSMLKNVKIRAALTATT